LEKPEKFEGLRAAWGEHPRAGSVREGFPGAYSLETDHKQGDPQISQISTD
jgi:hypothetical protein